jgi:hypothetical protein
VCVPFIEVPGAAAAPEQHKRVICAAESRKPASPATANNQRSVAAWPRGADESDHFM